MIGPLLQAVKLASFAAFVGLLVAQWAPHDVALLVAAGVYWLVLSLFL